MLDTFTPFDINGTIVKNRILRSATMENMADEDGFVTDQLLELYSNLARGGVGLIVTGASAVEKRGKVWDHQVALWDDRYLDGLSRLSAAIHQGGNGCKCAVQLHHGGASGYGYSYGGIDTTADLYKLTKEDIKNSIKAFGDAASRVKQAGFDAVAVHGAHGYFISQFLSPVINKRSDQWGGNLANRMRFALEVGYAIKEKIGQEIPLLWKTNCEDYLEGGQGVEEYAQVAAKIAESGVDLVEISGGLKDQMKLRARLRKQVGASEAYFIHAIKPFREAVGDKTALAVTGGIRTIPAMEKLLQDGLDFVGMARPLICEPDLPTKLQQAQEQTTPKCISCSKCLPGISGGPLKCVEFGGFLQKGSPGVTILAD